MIQPVHAAPVDKAAANKYYANCMADRSSHLNADDRQAICACTSAQLVRMMTDDDMRNVSRDDATGRAAFNKMLVDVYAPCMDQPVRNSVRASCMADMSVPSAVSDTVCACAAKLTGDWYALSGRQLMVRALQGNPGLTDPVGPVVQTAEFTHERDKNIQSCMTDH